MNPEVPPGHPAGEALVVGDIGNTSARFARVAPVSDAPHVEPTPPIGAPRPPEFLTPIRISTRDLTTASFRRIVAEFGGINALWRIASVDRSASQMLASWRWPAGSASRIQLVTYLDFPMPIAVDHPERVGIDRLAAAYAAGQLKHPTSPAIVIDAGTAVTIDAVAADRTFLGGTISPGFAVSVQALNRHTSQLPLVEDLSTVRDRSVIGRNTDEAISNGVWWSCVGGVREIVDRIRAELGAFAELFITGGDGPILAPHLSETARVVPDLVWRGLVW